MDGWLHLKSRSLGCIKVNFDIRHEWNRLECRILFLSLCIYLENLSQFQECVPDNRTPCTENEECDPMCSTNAKGLCDLLRPNPVCVADSSQGGPLN